MKKDNEGFLRRWSNRKKSIENISSKSGTIPEVKNESVNEEILETEQDSLEGLSDDEILKKLKLPNPEGMKKGDDFKAFLTKKVPEHLKRKALRRLWLSNPLFGHLDGMNEYDEDFTLATSALEKFATNYVVGKGFRGQFSSDGDDELNDNLVEEDLKTSSVRLSDSSEKNKIRENFEVRNETEEETKTTDLKDEIEQSKEELRSSEIDKDSNPVKETLVDLEEVDSIQQDANHKNTSQSSSSRIRPKRMIFKT